LAGETEVFRENLPQCHLVHHKSYMTGPGLEPGPHGGKPDTNHLIYGMAIFIYVTEERRETYRVIMEVVSLVEYCV
jgi:hypothetical protein